MLIVFESNLHSRTGFMNYTANWFPR